MKLKLDENLPESLVATLTTLGHDADNVRLENLAGHSDSDIWQAAQTASRFLITQDLDFSDIRKFAPGTHHGLLLLRLQSPGRLAMARRVSDLFRNEDVASWTRCFVMVTDSKIRVRRPN